LAETPSIGKYRNDLQQGLLSFPYESHVLYYTESKNGIVIVRVLHKGMDVERHFNIY
jgi:toxin ParE1/3/4